MSEFISKLDEKIVNKKKELEKIKNSLNQLENETPRNQHKINEIQKKVRNAEKYIENHQKLKEDPTKALEADKKAREIINREINWSYYTSSKFFKNTAKEAGKKGLKMGVRQALGLVLDEIWFELREQIPKLYQKCKNKFNIQIFLNSIQETLKGIWKRIQERFKDLKIYLIPLKIVYLQVHYQVLLQHYLIVFLLLKS
ncbi:hypothetical protein [Rodentibacter genomosp. 1]|uniref:hypothetical protein n=1 Tax=Rodentibacter genomosp. 1 TaxID=1908264 RepID=UPI0009854BF1|nr:hypothetical protein [Rodentibacter genomosp. 1]